MMASWTMQSNKEGNRPDPKKAPSVEPKYEKYYRECPVCGKRFYVDNANEWGFKRPLKGGTKLICTYSCCRVIDRKRGEH